MTTDQREDFLTGRVHTKRKELTMVQVYTQPNEGTNEEKLKKMLFYSVSVSVRAMCSQTRQKTHTKKNVVMDDLNTKIIKA